MAGVKKELHLEFSDVAQTSRVKGPCEISQARNSSQGVDQSIFLLEKCTFPNDFPDMTFPYRGRHAALGWGARPADSGKKLTLTVHLFA